MAAVQPETPAVSLRQKLFRRKPVGVMSAETGADTGGGELARTIGLFQLTLFGVGATIGTGIFVILTEAVPTAGPAVIPVPSPRNATRRGAGCSRRGRWPCQRCSPAAKAPPRT